MSTKYPYLFQIADAARTATAAARGLTRDQHLVQDALRSQFGGVSRSSGIILPWYSAPPDTAAGQEMRSRHLRSVGGSVGRREIRAMGAFSRASYEMGGESQREQRAALAATTTGNYLVGEDVPEIGQSLRDALVLERMGARVFGGLQHNVKFPRGRAQISAEWLSETAAAAGSDEEVASLNLTPHRVTAFVDVSEQLILQQQASEPFLRVELLSALAEEIQRVAIAGKGAANEPTGLVYTPGMPLVYAGGGSSESAELGGVAPTYEDFVEMEYRVTGEGKADRGHLGWLASPLGRKCLRTTRRAGDSDANIWPDDDPYSLLGHPAGVTTGVPDNLGAAEDRSAFVFGEMSELILPIWGPGILVDAVSSRDFAIAGKVRLIATAYVDAGARFPTAFTAMKDANCRG